MYSFNPNLTAQIYPTQPSGSAPSVADASWAVTVYENKTSTQYALWYSTGGANYSDDLSLYYDVCGILVLNGAVSADA